MRDTETDTHLPSCVSGNAGPTWQGSPNPANPDSEWICDECGAIIEANLQIPGGPPRRVENLDRNTTIKRIKAALQKRSGKAWSVTGGRGTAWGWIHIDAPPARRTWGSREKPGVDQTMYHMRWSDQYEQYDTGEPGHSSGPQDREELAKLLGVELSQVTGGVGVPASSDYYQEYIDRAEGKTPSVIGQPYWD